MSGSDSGGRVRRGRGRPRKQATGQTRAQVSNDGGQGFGAERTYDAAWARIWEVTNRVEESFNSIRPEEFLHLCGRSLENSLSESRQKHGTTAQTLESGGNRALQAQPKLASRLGQWRLPVSTAIQKTVFENALSECKDSKRERERLEERVRTVEAQKQSVEESLRDSFKTQLEEYKTSAAKERQQWMSQVREELQQQFDMRLETEKKILREQAGSRETERDREFESWCSVFRAQQAKEVELRMQDARSQEYGQARSTIRAEHLEEIERLTSAHKASLEKQKASFQELVAQRAEEKGSISAAQDSNIQLRVDLELSTKSKDTLERKLENQQTESGARISSLETELTRCKARHLEELKAANAEKAEELQKMRRSNNELRSGKGAAEREASGLRARVAMIESYSNATSERLQSDAAKLTERLYDSMADTTKLRESREREMKEQRERYEKMLESRDEFFNEQCVNMNETHSGFEREYPRHATKDSNVAGRARAQVYGIELEVQSMRECVPLPEAAQSKLRDDLEACRLQLKKDREELQAREKSIRWLEKELSRCKTDAEKQKKDSDATLLQHQSDIESLVKEKEWLSGRWKACEKEAGRLSSEMMELQGYGQRATQELADTKVKLEKQKSDWHSVNESYRESISEAEKQKALRKEHVATMKNQLAQAIATAHRQNEVLAKTMVFQERIVREFGFMKPLEIGTNEDQARLSS